MIEIIHLTKRYGQYTAIDSLELTVKKGELFGFLGPNGAGKTTTIRIMAGLLKPTAGTVILSKKTSSKIQRRPKPFLVLFRIAPFSILN